MKKIMLMFLLVLAIGLVGCNSTNEETYNFYYNLFHDGLLGACDLNAEKCGYVNKNFEVEIPYIYSQVGVFSDGVALVKDGLSYGVIDTNNEVVIPFLYDNIRRDIDNGVIKGYQDDEVTYFDNTGEVLSFKEAHLKQGYSEDTLFLYSEIDLVTTQGRKYYVYGYKDIDGNIAIEAEYEDYTEVTFTDHTIVGDGSYYMVLSSSGNTTKSRFCYKVYRSVYEGYISIEDQEDLWGISDYSGNITVEPIYEDSIVLNDYGYGVTQNSNDEFGLIKYDGTVILDTEYSLYGGRSTALSFYDQETAIFYNDTISYLYNSEGELIYTTEELIYRYFNDYVIERDRETNDYSICDLEGNVVIENFYNFNIADNNYIIIENRSDDFVITKFLYDSELDLVDIELGMYNFPSNFILTYNDKPFLALDNNETEESYLYSDDFDLVASFASGDLSLYQKDIIFWEDDYITYYDSENKFNVLNEAGEEIFTSESIIMYREYSTGVSVFREAF